MSVVDYRKAGLGRFRNLNQRERWGYGVWLFAGAVIAVGDEGAPSDDGHD
jgi:hypothetical protein